MRGGGAPSGPRSRPACQWLASTLPLQSAQGACPGGLPGVYLISLNRLPNSAATGTNTGGRPGMQLGDAAGGLSRGSRVRVRLLYMPHSLSSIHSATKAPAKAKVSSGRVQGTLQNQGTRTTRGGSAVTTSIYRSLGDQPCKPPKSQSPLSHPPTRLKAFSVANSRIPPSTGGRREHCSQGVMTHDHENEAGWC